MSASAVSSLRVHELPQLDEPPGLGGRLVHRAVAVTLVAVAILAATLVAVLLAVRVEITVAAGGVLEPLQVWRVHSFAAGVVREVRVASGERVERGEVLARLDPFALETELESLRLEARQKRHGRDASRDELERLEQAIATLEERLRRRTILAPESGVLLSEELDRLIGQHVREGQLLFEIGSAGAWKAVLDVAEREIDPIRVGDVVKLTVPAVADLESWMPERLPATVTFVGSELLERSTPSQGLYRLHAEVDADALDAAQRARFRRGMSTEARVVTRSARAVDLLVRHLKRQAGVDG